MNSATQSGETIFGDPGA